MNRLAVSVGILTLISAGSAAAVIATEASAMRMTELVDSAEQCFSSGDTKGCIYAAEKLSETWDELLHYSILITDPGQALEISSSVAEILSFAQAENEEIFASCDRAQAQIKMFREMQTPTLWKIL